MKKILEIQETGESKLFRFEKVKIEEIGAWNNKKAIFIYNGVYLIFENKEKYINRYFLNNKKNVFKTFIKEVFTFENKEIKVLGIFGKIEVQIKKNENEKIYFSGNGNGIFGNTKFINCSKYDFINFKNG